jgi:hypothetical protein
MEHEMPAGLGFGLLARLAAFSSINVVDAY